MAGIKIMVDYEAEGLMLEKDLRRMLGIRKQYTCFCKNKYNRRPEHEPSTQAIPCSTSRTLQSFPAGKLA